jgi:hypothetical protein
MEVKDGGGKFTAMLFRETLVPTECFDVEAVVGGDHDGVETEIPLPGNTRETPGITGGCGTPGLPLAVFGGAAARSGPSSV